MTVIIKQRQTGYNAVSNISFFIFFVKIVISSPPVTTPDTELTLLISNSFATPALQTHVQSLLVIHRKYLVIIIIIIIIIISSNNNNNNNINNSLLFYFSANRRINQSIVQRCVRNIKRTQRKASARLGVTVQQYARTARSYIRLTKTRKWKKIKTKISSRSKVDKVSAVGSKTAYDGN